MIEKLDFTGADTTALIDLLAAIAENAQVKGAVKIEVDIETLLEVLRRYENDRRSGAFVAAEIERLR